MGLLLAVDLKMPGRSRRPAAQTLAEASGSCRGQLEHTGCVCEVVRYFQLVLGLLSSGPSGVFIVNMLFNRGIPNEQFSFEGHIKIARIANF